MKEIRLVGTDEGSFDYNRNLDFEIIKDKKIEIQLHAEMVFKEGVDRVLFQIQVRYILGKEQLISYSVFLWFIVREWSDYVKGMSDRDVLALEETYSMLDITVGFLRGSLSLQERSTPFKGAFLPIVDINSLMKEVKVNRLKDKMESV